MTFFVPFVPERQAPSDMTPTEHTQILSRIDAHLCKLKVNRAAEQRNLRAICAILTSSPLPRDEKVTIADTIFKEESQGWAAAKVMAERIMDAAVRPQNIHPLSIKAIIGDLTDPD